MDKGPEIQTPGLPKPPEAVLRQAVRLSSLNKTDKFPFVWPSAEMDLSYLVRLSVFSSGSIGLEGKARKWPCPIFRVEA